MDYDPLRRAWGEDLCEVLIQAVFDDNSVGPVLHVVCKPTGLWVERSSTSASTPTRGNLWKAPACATRWR